MATTFDTIRAQQMALIEALTPSQHSSVKFRRHRDAVRFDAWVEANQSACFRRFEMLRNFDDDIQPTSDGSLEGVRHTVELRVAYPLELGLYGDENVRDMEALIDADRRLIEAAIGINGLADYVDSQHDCRLESYGVAEVPGAWLLSATYSLLYDRSV